MAKYALAIAPILMLVFLAGCMQPEMRACTLDAKICPDGSAVGRNASINCEFNACPAPVACTMEAKLCPDGSAVGRQGPNCEFAPCPSTRACTLDVKFCPDGSAVGRNASLNCGFNPCPDANFTLYGKISIGPLCPVEPCERMFDYSGAYVNVYSANGNTLIAKAHPDSDGSYGFSLAQGDYLVNVTDSYGRPLGMPRTGYTQTVSLGRGQKIEMDFDIDTGIR